MNPNSNSMSNQNCTARDTNSNTFKAKWIAPKISMMTANITNGKTIEFEVEGVGAFDYVAPS